MSHRHTSASDMLSMPLTSGANQETNPPSSESDGPGQRVSGEKIPSNIRLAANDPAARQNVTEHSAMRTGPIQFLAKRQATVLEVLAEFTDQTTLSAALLAFSNTLQHRFQCERVVVGLAGTACMNVTAISQQAVIELRTNEVRLLSNAMQEACDQQSAIQYTGTASNSLMTDAHQALSLEHEKAHIYTLPLCDKERVIGALLLQRRSGQAWSPLTLELFTQIAVLVAPLIALRRDAERSIFDMIRVRTSDKLTCLTQPRHLMKKAAAVLVILLTVFAYCLPVTHVVKASAELMPTERRVVSAPANGFISRVFVNAGDHVRAGDTLLQLETRELELQQAGQENQRLSTRAELRSAMASYDRNEVAIAQARLAKIDAELALTGQQISRAELKAPVDGVIVTGDMSQTLGMTVERGNVLMEISPVEGFEVQLLVHEVDMPYVRLGQSGRLLLAADPGHVLPVAVSAIHPIAMASEGASRFLVETVLEQQSLGLRPGQTGIVKLDVGKARLLWVWTHAFLEWSRQRLWEWFG